MGFYAAEDDEYSEDHTAVVPANDEPPNYVMFAITFLVIAYSIYKYLQKKRRRGVGSAPVRRPAGRAPAPQRQNRFFNGGVGAGGGGSSTMTEAPPDHLNSDPEHSSQADVRAPNDTRALEKLLGRTLQRGSVTVPTQKALSRARVVGIYFSAHWCPPCRSFTPVLAQCYEAVKEVHGEGQFEVVFVSSDRSKKDFEQYLATMPWLSLKYADESARKSLAKHFNVSSLPTLLLVSPTSGRVLEVDGRGKVAADPSGNNFPWVEDPSAKKLFSGGGRSLVSGAKDATSPARYASLSRRERAAMMAEKAEALRKAERARAAAAAKAASEQAGSSESTSRQSPKKPTLTVLRDAAVDSEPGDGEHRLRVNDKTVAPRQLVTAANLALAKVGAEPFVFTFGGVAVELSRTASKSLSVVVEGSSKPHIVEITEGGVELHLSKNSVCLGDACLPWQQKPKVDVEDTKPDCVVDASKAVAAEADKTIRPSVDRVASPKPQEPVGDTTTENDDAGSIPHTAWMSAPALKPTDFFQPSEEESQGGGAKEPDDFECPVGVQHIHHGMTEMSKYFRDAEKHGLAVMVDYYATWCGPCRAIAPFYDELAAMYAGKMIFLKVDCGGRGPDAPNQDVKRFSGLQAFPTFHVYKNGEKVADVRGARRDELSSLAATYALNESGGDGKPNKMVLRTAFSVSSSDFEARRLFVVGSGSAATSATAKPLSASKAKKVLTKLAELAEANIFPFETPLDFDALSKLTKECLTQNLYWHTDSTSLLRPQHSEGVAEITRALTHTVEPGSRPWWALEHLYPLLDLAEAVLLHPESRLMCGASGKTKFRLYDAIVVVAERLVHRKDAAAWLAKGVGRATFERIISCLTLMTSPNDMAVDSTESDGGVSSTSFPWLEAAANAGSLIPLVTQLSTVACNAAQVDESSESPRVKGIEKLLRDVARLLFNTGVLQLRAPLSWKKSAEIVTGGISELIESSLAVLEQLQLLTISVTKLAAPVVDGQTFALRSACTALVQVNGVFPVHPEAVKKGLYTASGVPAALAQSVWAKYKAKLLQRAITSVTKSANFLNTLTDGADDEIKAAAGQQMKKAARETVELMTQTAPHPGQTTKPFPNAWGK